MTEILTAATREALRDVMVRAGELVLSARRDGQELGVEAKGGSANYVTAYDKAVQALLEREFSELLPGCEFLAEEDPDNGGFKRGDRPVFKNGEGFTFVIDPIDGTTNFINDYRVSAISAGLMFRGEPVWGGVLQPYTGEFFSALKGGGAYSECGLCGRGGAFRKTRLRVTDRALRDSVVIFGTSPYYRSTLGRYSMAAATELLMNSGDLRRSGSAALDLCMLAAGRADGFFELRLSPWDYAAGGLILEEAGGVVTDLNGAKLPVRRGAVSSVVAGNPNNYSEIISVVRGAVPDGAL
ncbi:MAG: inositol monophosphatase [Clostridia bacterium]|nr:inositol monophosphatase [Clostridia bacterium]